MFERGSKKPERQQKPEEFPNNETGKYVNAEFGKLFSEYIGQKFKTHGDAAKCLESRLESELGLKAGSYNAYLGTYNKGNLLGSAFVAARPMLPKKIPNAIKRLSWILYALEVDRNSRMIEIARQKFGTDFDYPPKPIQPA